jgi:hypothetical protein
LSAADAPALRRVPEGLDWVYRGCMEPAYRSAMSPVTGAGGVAGAAAGEGILDLIARSLRELLDTIAPWNFFPWLERTVVAPWRTWFSVHVFNPLTSLLWGLLGAAQNWWHNIIEGVKRTLNAVATTVGQVLASATVVLGSLVRAATDAAAGVTRSALGVLQSVVGLIPQQIRDRVRELTTQTVAMLQHLGVQLAVIGTQGLPGITRRIGEWVLNYIGTEAARSDLLNRFITSWPGQLLVSLTNALRGLWDLVLAGIRTAWDRLSPIILSKADRAISAARPYVEKWVEGFQSVPATFLEWVAATAGTNLALNPAKALETTGTLYSMSLAAGSLAMITSTALNMIPTTNWVGMSQFSAFIAEAAGFEPLTRATYGVLVNEALTIPLRYYWNWLLRPRLPTEGTLFLMGRKRGLSAAEFKHYMACQGIPDDLIDQIRRFSWTDPSPYWLLRMSEAANPTITPSAEFLPWLEEWLPNWRSNPWAWFEMKLMLAGFEDTDIPAFIEGFRRRALQSPTTQYKTSVRALTREAYVSREQVQGLLRPLGVREDEIELLFAAEELDYQKGYLDDEIRFYQEAFRKGELSEQDLQLALSTIIVRPERVAQIVARERVRALPTPKKIVPVKENALVQKLRRQAVDSWVNRYRAWAISEDDLLFGLALVVEDKALAEEMVRTELLRYREPPPEGPPPEEDPLLAQSRRQSIATWIAAFRNGDITASELELGLAPYIKDRDLIVQIRQLEELRYRPTPELVPLDEEDPEMAALRAETVRGHIEQFRKRLTPLALLYTYLLADGLTPALARATVITEASKRIQPPKLDSPYYLEDVLRDLQDQGVAAYENLYLAGRITLQDYVSWLTTLQVDANVITYLADRLELRFFLGSGTV